MSVKFLQMRNDFYVYVYIDPRNFEEFYYGKGCGSRKDAHVSDNGDTDKSHRIDAIHKAGLKPIIRVVARNLSERDAFLIEKTMLWKLGRQLTNIAPGHYSENFRPHNTLHLELSGFDYRCGVYYFNVGECHRRNWDDCKKFGFIAAGGGIRWRDAILGFEKGDVLAAYLKNHGFVGVGIINERAKPIREAVLNGKPLLNHALCCAGMGSDITSDELCEYVAPVKWVKVVERSKAKWKPKSGLYTTQLVRASLDAQPETVAFLEQEFAMNIRELAV